MILTDHIITQLGAVGRIPPERLATLRKESGDDTFEFVRLASQHGWLETDVAGKVVGDMIQRAYLKLDSTLFQPDIVKLLPQEMAERYQAIPVYKFGEAVTVALTSPEDTEVVQTLSRLIGHPIDPLLCFPGEVDAAIQVNYQSGDMVDRIALSVDFNALTNVGDDTLAKLAPIVELSDSLVLLALKERATDIHIEPKKHECLVRFRIDGMLCDRLYLPEKLARPLTSRFKVLANMDIAEKRKPQDGRFDLATPRKNIDIRISTLPTLYGEKTVMRLLGSLTDSVPLNIDKLGIAPEILQLLKETLQAPNGILFVTGPTGSGKTTTLYAALNYIDKPDVNITTIEDPVEYEIPSLNQVQIDERAGRPFPAVLRAILRQDPDVILVGEIRDVETATIATKAALTGHTVLSSLHTNNALQAMLRLIDMGVEPHSVAPAVIGVLGQRLVRRICEYCKTPYTPDSATLEKYFFWEDGSASPVFYRGEGCERCADTGYCGRLGIHEFFQVSPTMRDYILGGRTYTEVRALAYREGFQDMRFDGFVKALQGFTSLEEIIRVTAAD